jgi:hypothetical protein
LLDVLAKTCVLILSLGAAACVLLGLRQARLQAMHEIAGIQRRMNDHDRNLFRLRLEIAERVTPERVEQAAQKLGPMAPIGVDPPEAGEGQGEAKPPAGGGRAGAGGGTARARAVVPPPRQRPQ